VTKARGKAPRPRRRAASLVVAGLGLAVAAGACGGGSGGPGVAQAGTPTTTAASSQHAPTKASLLAFAQCMRAHGVASFPDPDSSGRIAVQAGQGTGIDPRSPQFQAAQQACKAYAPFGVGTSRKVGDRATLLRFSRCMRSHGVADFPDPNGQGGIAITGGPSGDLDPNSPQFQSAQRACQHLLPGGKGGPKPVTVQGPSQ